MILGCSLLLSSSVLALAVMTGKYYYPFNIWFLALLEVYLCCIYYELILYDLFNDQGQSIRED